MEMNSYEIDRFLFNRQLNLYQRIDDMIKRNFEELDSDKLAVLSRTLLELEERMQYFKKSIRSSEMFGVNYNSIRRVKNVNELSLLNIINKMK